MARGVGGGSLVSSLSQTSLDDASFELSARAWLFLSWRWRDPSGRLLPPVGPSVGTASGRAAGTELGRRPGPGPSFFT